MKTADVVIAGAGIAGISTAYQLAEQHGLTDIILVDPLPPLTLTSNKTGANYRDWWPARPMVELARRSIQLMDEMVKSGAPFTMNRRGYLYISTRADFQDALPELLAPYRAAGLESGADVLDRNLIRRSYPHLSRQISGALHARNAGTLDTLGLGRYLLATATRCGVGVIQGEVVRVDVTGGRVGSVGVTAQGGTTTIATKQFVNAAGPFAGRVARLLGQSLPLMNVLQQKVAFPDPARAVPDDAPFTIGLDPVAALPAGLHIKPDVVEGKPVVKLGCAYNRATEEPGWDPLGAPEFPDQVLRAAAQLIPALEAYVGRVTPVAHEAGYYTKTPDELPLIGPCGLEGAFVVGGMAGYGAMVACAAGEIAASWIAGATQPALATGFKPDRFDNPALPAAGSSGNAFSGAL